MITSKRKLIKKLIWICIIGFISMNFIAYFHAYKFTHFDATITTKTKEADKLSFVQKLNALFFGVKNPRPIGTKKPLTNYETIKLKSNKDIESWVIKKDSSKGTVILFHGFSGEKSSMLDKSEAFAALGYSTMLVDFMGCGGSQGNQTTIGFYEAKEVKTCFDYLKSNGEKNIILFGTSMGAVAIMKAISDYKLQPTSIIIECPFGSMLKTAQARFKSMIVPSFPMANLLVFWGGVQNKFNAFKHNPIEYAKNIKVPTLLMYGKTDEKVSQKETDNIYRNLAGFKKLKIFEKTGHENYLIKNRADWIKEVDEFLGQ